MPEVDFTSDLWLFASPWCEEKLDDVGSIDALVRAWVALWNYTADRTSMDADQIRRTCRGLFDIPTDELIGILAKRKEAFFPDDTRVIVSYRVTMGSEDFTVLVEFADRDDRRTSEE